MSGRLFFTGMLLAGRLTAGTLLVEAEAFAQKGGWVVDQQFMDQMGSPFLMAHGMGVPVADASTEVRIPEAGRYRVLVRTRNWAAPWTRKKAPGRFQVEVNGKRLDAVLGEGGAEWAWQEAGAVALEQGAARLGLHDLTGFNGRCDAVVLTTEASFTPATDVAGLEWVAHMGGKRESRRLLGDLVLKEQDIIEGVAYPDATACTTWTIDLHYPDPKNTRNFAGNEFKSIAKHILIDPYPVPYRCLYSKNVENLFLSGRSISVTHVALGTVRVMRTGGMLGEVAGMAAALCKKHACQPRDIYATHFEELKALMAKGVGLGKPQPSQAYNGGRPRTKEAQGAKREAAETETMR